MSSREISELVESRHDSVKRSMETLRDKGIISFTQTVETSHEGSGARPVDVYMVNKRDSYVVVAQLSPEFTARLVDRWQELEAKQEFAVPKTLSSALRLAAEQAEQIEAQALQLEKQKPAVEFVERYTIADSGSKGFREVCKILKANENQFKGWLIENKIMYRLAGVLTAHQNHIDADRFEIVAGEANGHAYNRCKFTTKGIVWVAGEWAKHCLPK
jgi:phage antirepressor YoqD-like protein